MGKPDAENKFFLVEVTKLIVVQSDSSASANMTARAVERKEDPDNVEVQEITNMSEVPKIWRESRPYGGDGKTQLADLLEDDLEEV